MDTSQGAAAPGEYLVSTSLNPIALTLSLTLFLAHNWVVYEISLRYSLYTCIRRFTIIHRRYFVYPIPNPIWCDPVDRCTCTFCSDWTGMKCEAVVQGFSARKG